MEFGNHAHADERERNLWRKIAIGETLDPADRAFLDGRNEERVAKYRAERAELRVGDSARARFYRLKDERLSKVGPVIEALHVYHQKKRASSDDKPFADENAEAVLRAYGLLRWAMKALDDDADDEDAFEISRQCFDMMAPLVAAFIPRWL